ncbi:MAG: hypothetical protein WC986_13780 [Elusimicrobiota bacterium]|jgi:gliding motility-associated-like protein
MGRLALAWGIIALQTALWPAFAHAGNPDDLSLTVTIVPPGPPAGITDLTATPTAVDGAVQLTWTEPGDDGWFGTASTYTIRVSTLANIENDSDFNDPDLAHPLAEFSPSVIGLPGLGQSLRTELIIGLTPGVTYYFAIRATDDDAPTNTGPWSRAGSDNANNFTVAPDYAPAMPRNLHAVSSSGTVRLTWDANLEPDIDYYVIYRDSDGVADDFVWYSTTSGTLFLDGSLTNRTSYYYRIQAVDTPPSVLSSPLTPWVTGYPDAVRVSEFGAQSKNRRILLLWKDLPSTSITADFVGYKIYRSTANEIGSRLVALTTGTVAVDTCVVVGTTYYYQATAEVSPGYELERSSIVAVFARSAPPLSPLGLGLTATAPNTMVLSWPPVETFDDWQSFAVSTAPVPDELNGYRIYRATAPAGAIWTAVTTVSTATLSHTMVNPSQQDYYQVCSINAGDLSRPYLVRSVATRDAYIAAPDDASTVEIPAAIADALFPPSRTDYMIVTSSHPEDLGGRILKSVAFTAVRGGIPASAGALQMPGPVSVRLHYDLLGGVVRASASQPATPDQLSVYWHNGQRWVQLYGKLDGGAQVVEVETRNLGRYQLRAVERTGGFTFNAAGISNRMITPNNDGMNDIVVFTFDNPRDSKVTGKIFDLKGAFVGDMTPGPIAQSLMWDAKAGGKPVPGGVYIYQIESEDKTINGTVVVIK